MKTLAFVALWGGVAAGLVMAITALRSRWRMVAVAGFLAVASFTAPLTPVSAHDYWTHESGWRTRNTADNQCTWGWSYLNHGYEQVGVASYQRYYWGPTWSPYYYDCTDSHNQAAGNMAVRAAYYHDGIGPCVVWPWIKNDVTSSALTVNWPHDVFWDGCNAGAGVWTWVTQDTWQYVHNNNSQLWDGGSARPAEGHCHCP